MSKKTLSEIAEEKRQERLAEAKSAPPLVLQEGPTRSPLLDDYVALIEFGASCDKKPHEVDAILKTLGVTFNSDRPGPLLCTGNYSWEMHEKVKRILSGEPELEEQVSAPEPPAPQVPPLASAETVDFDKVVAEAPTVVAPAVSEVTIDELGFEEWYVEQDADIQEMLPCRLEERIVLVVDDWDKIVELARQGLEIGGVTLAPQEVQS